MNHSQRLINSPESPVRRSDAGQLRIQQRDVYGLLTLADQYAAPYDLLAARLRVTESRLRGIVARWRGAGLAATGRLSEGPAWCWLTPAGMKQVGHPWEAGPPALSRLAHIRACLAARIWLEGTDEWAAGRAQWRCERRLREGRPAAGQHGHTADAEIMWPAVPGSPRAGETWAVEVELTPKAADRTQEIMAGLLNSRRYSQVLYLVAPAARHAVTVTAAKFPAPAAARVTVRDLPPVALVS